MFYSSKISIEIKAKDILPYVNEGFELFVLFTKTFQEVGSTNHINIKNYNPNRPKNFHNALGL